MNHAILGEGGTVMQFVGDAVMAVFGAPFPQDDHADRAVAAAAVMHELQAGINTRWELDGLPPFGLGLGLSTGEAAAALLGSAERLEYTLVGDTVNLCQRLQQLADKGETVASEATVKALRAAVDTILLGAQQVKGRETPVIAYKIVCRDAGPAAAAQAGPADPGPASNSTSHMGGLCLRASPH
jgi:class 3 adenylate cyclase